MGAVSVQVAVEGWLHQGTQRQAVAGGDQVDGVAQQRDAHRAPLGDQLGQLVEVEALRGRPQSDVGRVGGLGLHADQLLDRLGSRELPAAQQLPVREATCE